MGRDTQESEPPFRKVFTRTFLEDNRNTSRYQLADIQADAIRTLPSASLVTMSQGGVAALHLYAEDFSTLDSYRVLSQSPTCIAGPDGPVIQALAAPFLGSETQSEPYLPTIASIFGIGCGFQLDLVPFVSIIRTLNEPTWAMEDMTTSAFGRPRSRSGPPCNRFTSLLLPGLDDGAVSEKSAGGLRRYFVAAVADLSGLSTIEYGPLISPAGIGGRYNSFIDPDSGECHRDKQMNWRSLLNNAERTEALIEQSFVGECKTPGTRPEPCESDVCGTVPGGLCGVIRAPRSGEDYASTSAHPNGAYSEFNLCFDDPTSGQPMVCNPEHFTGSGGFDAPICRTCEPGSPRAGCPCDPNSAQDCGGGLQDELECHPSGVCVVTGPTFVGLPEWQCEADCTRLYGVDGYCYHGKPWAEEVSSPAFDVPRASIPPICASLDCSLSGSACASGLSACDSGECVSECTIPAGGSVDCADSNVSPIPGFSSGYVCDTSAPTSTGGGVCVLD